MICDSLLRNNCLFCFVPLRMSLDVVLLPVQKSEFVFFFNFVRS